MDSGGHPYCFGNFSACRTGRWIASERDGRSCWSLRHLPMSMRKSGRKPNGNVGLPIQTIQSRWRATSWQYRGGVWWRSYIEQEPSVRLSSRKNVPRAARPYNRSTARYGKRRTVSNRTTAHGNTVCPRAPSRCTKSTNAFWRSDNRASDFRMELRQSVVEVRNCDQRNFTADL